jgi:hypothetical protein
MAGYIAYAISNDDAPPPSKPVIGYAGVGAAAGPGVSGAREIDAHVGIRLRLFEAWDDFRFDPGPAVGAQATRPADAIGVITYALATAAPAVWECLREGRFDFAGVGDRFDFDLRRAAPAEEVNPEDLTSIVHAATVSTQSLVMPLSGGRASFAVDGPLVVGTDRADLIVVGPRAEVVKGGQGNDILVSDPDTGGAPRMTILDGGRGADTYVDFATTNRSATAALPGCRILDFTGPFVLERSSRDTGWLVDFDADEVAARHEGDLIHFRGGGKHLYLDFRDQNYDRLSEAEIASALVFGPERDRLTAAELFVDLV